MIVFFNPEHQLKIEGFACRTDVKPPWSKSVIYHIELYNQIDLHSSEKVVLLVFIPEQ